MLSLQIYQHNFKCDSYILLAKVATCQRSNSAETLNTINDSYVIYSGIYYALFDKPVMRKKKSSTRRYSVMWHQILRTDIIRNI